ncbi:hypothetical protein BKD26_37930 [Streptomyces sp. CB03238]|nr:hypothetical protein BKD26_37930 [Streptomyces sp. CB03238]
MPEETQVLQFLAGRSLAFYHLVGGITAAWAHDGQRVLMLQEHDSFWRLTSKTEDPIPPEADSTVLWQVRHLGWGRW